MTYSVLACAGRGAPMPPEPAAGEREEYVIGIPDRLKIVVWKNPELTRTNSRSS